MKFNKRIGEILTDIAQFCLYLVGASLAVMNSAMIIFGESNSGAVGGIALGLGLVALAEIIDVNKKLRSVILELAADKGAAPRQSLLEHDFKEVERKVFARLQNQINQRGEELPK